MTLGPVQLLVLAFDRPNFTGEIVGELARLRDNDMIRLVDALVVQKGEDGELTVVQWSDLSIAEAQDMGALAGALIGIGEGGGENVDRAMRAGRRQAPTATCSTTRRSGTSQTRSRSVARQRSR